MCKVLSHVLVLSKITEVVEDGTRGLETWVLYYCHNSNGAGQAVDSQSLHCSAQKQSPRKI